jgi:hypothetical protein
MLMSSMMRKVNQRKMTSSQRRIIFGKPFFFFANKIPHKNLSLSNLCTGTKNIIISFLFCLLSATIFIEAP